MKTYAKFALLVVAIVGTLAWLAVGGINETKTYYKTIAELNTMGHRATEQRIKVGGDVVGDIQRQGADVHFTLSQNALRLPVVYNGIDPLPDTFRPGAQAVADGRLGSDGVFHANKLQAKCASKYEAKPAQPRAPVNAGTSTM